jgi:lipopolysaccharide/colanic/teichoic acid biosynthesis glycosyltransferase
MVRLDLQYIEDRSLLLDLKLLVLTVPTVLLRDGAY